ncbi:MAG: hypothetical protein QG671_1473 [Actinomycetota bacterium]|nr:hypothetical protein [Actinomycetota bacterium]
MARRLSAVAAGTAVGVTAAATIVLLAVAALPSVATEPIPPPDASYLPLLAPLPPPTGPVPVDSALAVALSPLDGPALGGSVGAVVLDATSGQVLYSRQADQPRTPASTTKILTGTAVSTALGTATRLTTRTVKASDGAVILVGGGDPQLRESGDEHPGDATLADLASQTAAALRAAEPSVPASGSTPTATSASGSAATESSSPSVPPVSVMVDDTLFSGPTTSPDWPESLLATCIVRPIMALMVNNGMSPEEVPCEPESDPALAAGRTFARLLTAEGVPVTGEVGRRRAESTSELASVQSAPVADLIEQTLLRSDNTAAEILAHLAGGKLAGQASFAGGAVATDQALRGLGLSTSGLQLTDGSGLSREDRIPPLLLGQTLARVAANANAQLWPVGSGLPVAGFDGTLATRFDTAATFPGRGEVRAKTGTLTDIGALAGWVVDQNGRLLIFDFVSDKVVDTEEGRIALDRAASALATCGCTGAPN